MIKKQYTYNIINAEDELDLFINWLPELKDNEIFYFCLFARKKYAPEMVDSSDRSQLRRFVCRRKDDIYEKIKQLEAPLGSYKLKNKEVPQEALVLYMNPNPRDMKRATKVLGKKCWDLTENNHFALDHEVLSCIQKTKSKTHWVDFDIDEKDIDWTPLQENMPRKGYIILETRGGYHILVNTKVMKEEECNWGKMWYQKIKENFPVDESGDQLIPVPGTTQGGFTPLFHRED